MSKKTSRETKSLVTIPMDVVVLNILIFVIPSVYFPSIFRDQEKSIKDYYGYFRRDRTRKIYFLYRSFHVFDFRLVRHVFNIEKVHFLEFGGELENEFVQKFFSNSHRARSLSSLALVIGIHNTELLSRAFSKECCFPNLLKFRIITHSDLNDWITPVRLPTQQLQKFTLGPFDLTVRENNQIRIQQFPLILDTPSLENLNHLILDRVKPKHRIVLETPKVRTLLLRYCDNISLETGKRLVDVDVHGMKVEFVRKLFSSLHVHILRRFAIDVGYENQTNKDYTFLFDGQEGRAPLKKFRRLERVVLEGVEWSNEALGDNERIFPDESLEDFDIRSCKSLKRHHVNWSSEKLEEIHLVAVPLCLDPKVDLKNLKMLELDGIKGLTDDFFREAKFGKLEKISVWSCLPMVGAGWDDSFRRNLTVLVLDNVDVNNVLGSGNFSSLNELGLFGNPTKAAKWGQFPSLRKIWCSEKFLKNLKECNTEGNIDFERLERVSVYQ